MTIKRGTPLCGRRIIWLAASLLLPTLAHGQRSDTLAVSFGGGIGQVEVGGVFAGVEFHESRPVPARISFYYPVANSLDLSTDYWKRGASRPLTLTVRAGTRTDTLGTHPWAYEWTPYSVVFRDENPVYGAAMEYRFAAELPVVVARLTLVNRSTESARFEVESSLAMTLRTSHAYTEKQPTHTAYEDSAFLAEFHDAETDSVSVFVVVAEGTPEPTAGAAGPGAHFRFVQEVAPGDSLVVTQLIGTSRQEESAAVRARAAADWRDQVTEYEDGIRAYVRDSGRFVLSDPELRQTDGLARALLRANRHYLDGRVVPMPSPAEYNFFFTHDLLLTDLGAVFFDIDRVRDDLRYVQSLVQADSLLPHARYWRDSTYVIETANADNWNHLWAVLLSASYLKHSGDLATVEALYPTLQKSMALMLSNERDGLMYAERPDWWDIGHVYGPRAYLTTLMVRALEAYAYVSIRLGKDGAGLSEGAAAAGRMGRALVEELWDEEAGYLMNGLDSTSLDRHYYTGSLLAAAFDLLDGEKRGLLLATARRELLDEQVGMRNAMPADFHLLVNRYHFLEGEVGAPFLYMNGGVWPQGNAWYALALIAAGRVDQARSVVEKYMTLAGVEDSPSGQPAFYEYRNADPGSPTYGAIDKPTFLWAGGWYLHVLYQLAGVRESPWNLSFSPDLPGGFEDVAYDLAVHGRKSRVSWSGSGSSFRRILVDGRDTPSAVLLGPSERVELERGIPEAPYLAAATCIVDRVRRSEDGRGLSVAVRGIEGEAVTLSFVGPWPLTAVSIDGQVVTAPDLSVETVNGLRHMRLTWILGGSAARISLTP